MADLTLETHMLKIFVAKICRKIDASNFPHISKRQEKNMQWISVPALVAAVLFVFWSAQSTAADPDLTKFFFVHEAKAIVIPTQDASGEPVNEVRQIGLLVQLPGERFARRVLVNLDDNLLLDPRAPAPGEKTYSGIVETDGSFTRSSAAKP